MDISIIVPFYNGNKYLNKIKSMVYNNLQTLGTKMAIELIIVNDSPWVSINKSLFNKENDGFSMQFVELRENIGIHGARVQGIKASSGKYILLLDQDDEISDNYLKSQLNSIGDSDVSVSNGFRYIKNDKKKIYINQQSQKKIKSIFYYAYLENRILSPGHCLIKRDSIPTEWMQYKLSRNGADDLLLWILMLSKKRRFAVNPEYLYKHIDTGNNTSNNDNEMAKSTYEVCNIIKQIDYVPYWVSYIMNRKINNDVCYINSGIDRYIDYKLIELIRKMLHRKR